METITLETGFKNLQKALDLFITDFCSVYKGMLIRDGKKATGNLIASVKPLEIEFSNDRMSGSISIADYWKYVEHGRRPGGKFPPFDKILEWVRVKPILPRPVNGLKPTDRQIAFLISRKIARDGIEPGNQFSEALDLVWARQKQNISDAITADIGDMVDLITV